MIEQRKEFEMAEVMLPIANEVNRMEMNIARIDKEAKGVKQLQRSIDRIRQHLEKFGIETVKMLGMDYNAGMVADVEFEIDTTLPLGTSRIVMVNRPQVNFDGMMVQKAEIIVAQNI